MGRRSDEPRGWQGTPRRRCSRRSCGCVAAGSPRRGFVGFGWEREGGGDRGGKQSGAEVVGIELAKGARDARTHGAAREGWGVRLFGREMWGCLGVWRPARRGRGRGRWERGASPSLLTVGGGGGWDRAATADIHDWLPRERVVFG